MLVVKDVQDARLEPLGEARLLATTGRRSKKESMAPRYVFERTMLRFGPSDLHGNAHKRDGEVKILELFKICNGFRTIEVIKLTPTALSGPRSADL